jgi:hypothetical protein
MEDGSTAEIFITGMKNKNNKLFTKFFSTRRRRYATRE